MSGTADYLNAEFVKWQSKMGRPMNQKDFAEYLGVKPTTYSGWINSGIPPSYENIVMLAQVLGDEIYKVAGVPPPDKFQDAIAKAQAAYNALTPEQRAALVDRLETVIQETLIEFGAKRIK